MAGETRPLNWIGGIMNQKFRVGDKVKVIRGATKAEGLNRPELVGGQVCTVTDDSMPLDVRVDGHKWWFSNTRFEKVEDMEDKTNTVTLNGVTYKVEYIEGKGECLVPVREIKKGQVYKYKPNGNIWLVTTSDKMIMIEGNNVGAQLANGALDDTLMYRFLGNSVSEAAQKGLIK